MTWRLRCAIARLLDRLGRWVLQSSFRPTTVCVPREDTIREAPLDRLAFECAHRVSAGKNAQITVSRKACVIVAALTVREETFESVHAALRAELKYQSRVS